MSAGDRSGRIGAYGAASTLTPYLLIKVSWVAGALLGLAPTGTGFGVTGWVVLNTVTIGMAAAGIAVALALVRPWGLRIPAKPLVFCAWVGTGFLVPLVPYAVLDSLFGPADAAPERGGDDDPSMPGWEAVLMQIGFVGMGIGLALALPAYLRRRWPETFAGRVGDGRARTGAVQAAPWSALAAVAIGLFWLYWAAGGTVGIARPEERVLTGRLLTGVLGAWALLAAAAVLVIARGRPARLPRWIPLGIGWLGSGSLFAWSAWKLPYTLHLALTNPADAPLPENLAVAACLHAAAVAAGATMSASLVRRTGPGPEPRSEPVPGPGSAPGL
ncbi:hypothetical protein AB0B50_08700 [Streptomyces sp. NPDC041068]|uniref:hypothetical protein n=1 Tax=Streptomyces sp. NPDC041068 TaxID=3155130 RepID=UPI0033FA5163